MLDKISRRLRWLKLRLAGAKVDYGIQSCDDFFKGYAANFECGNLYIEKGCKIIIAGQQNSCSILEAFARIEAISGKKMSYEYVDKNREGDHICYISDLSKMQNHYPEWNLTKSLDDIFEEIFISWQRRSN